jgi:hypothetical protein
MFLYNKSMYRIGKKCLLGTFLSSDYILKYRAQHCRFYDCVRFDIYSEISFEMTEFVSNKLC